MVRQTCPDFAEVTLHSGLRDLGSDGPSGCGGVVCYDRSVIIFDRGAHGRDYQGITRMGLVNLPELGQLNSREIAALVGWLPAIEIVAPDGANAPPGWT